MISELPHFSIPSPKNAVQNRLKIFSGPLLKKMEKLLESHIRLISLQARYLSTNLRVQDNLLIFQDSFQTASASLAKHLSGCSRVTWAAVTIGSDLEVEMEKNMKMGKTFEALVLDAIGSESVEAGMNHVNRLITEEIRSHHFTPTRRYSPGYGDLSLTIQSQFFKLLRLTDLGMNLTASMLMIPQKSVTAFIGWRRNEFA